MYKYFLICIVFTLVGAFGGYFFKKAATTSSSIIKIIFNPFLYIGGVFYVIGAILNIIVLKKLSYTVVLPLTSITYVWTIIISYFMLKEKISLKKILGIVFIISGAVLLGIYS